VAFPSALSLLPTRQSRRVQYYAVAVKKTAFWPATKTHNIKIVKNNTNKRHAHTETAGRLKNIVFHSLSTTYVLKKHIEVILTVYDIIVLCLITRSQRSGYPYHRVFGWEGNVMEGLAEDVVFTNAASQGCLDGEGSERRVTVETRSYRQNCVIYSGAVRAE